MSNHFMVTVLMSVRNGEPYIKEAITSVLNQTYGNYNFLILDNASIDNSRSIIKEFKDSRIKLVELPEDIGQSKALNKGLEMINTKYVARMDADDVSLNERIEKQVQYLENHPDVGVLGTHVKMITNEPSLTLPIRRRPLTNNENNWRLLYSTTLMHSSVMFRHKLYKDYGGYDDNCAPAEDYELWSRYSKHTQVNQLKKILVLIRKHNLRTSIKNITKQKRMAEIIRKINLKNLVYKKNESINMDKFSEFISGKRENSTDWWYKVSISMMIIYRTFCEENLIRNNEFKGILNDYNTYFIEIPLKFKIYSLWIYFNSLNKGRKCDYEMIINIAKVLNNSIKYRLMLK